MDNEWKNIVRNQPDYEQGTREAICPTHRNQLHITYNRLLQFAHSKVNPKLPDDNSQEAAKRYITFFTSIGLPSYLISKILI